LVIYLDLDFQNELEIFKAHPSREWTLKLDEKKNNNNNEDLLKLFYVEAQESSLQVTNHMASENLQNEAQVPFLVAYVLCHLETPKVGFDGCPTVMLHQGLHK